MAKSPDRPHAPKGRDPAKHSKKDPAKPTRAKAARPDSAPLDPALADLLNPAIGRGRAGVGSQTGIEPRTRDNSIASPLAGEGGEGGREAKSRTVSDAQERRLACASPPDPHLQPLPTRGRGAASGSGTAARRGLSRRRTIHSIAAPISPTRIVRVRRSRAGSARRRSKVMSARRRFRPASSIRISRARSGIDEQDARAPRRTRQA